MENPNKNILPYPLSYTHNNVEEYLESKMKKSPVYPDEIDDSTRFQVFKYLTYFKKKTKGPEFAIIEFDLVPDAKLQSILLYQESFISDINKIYPLIANEEIKKDEIGYLLQAYDGFEANSLFLRRTTNFSDCLFVKYKSYIDLVKCEVYETRPALNEPMRLFTSNIDFTVVARDFAIALTGQAPFPYSFIASTLVTAIWPTEDVAGNAIQETVDRVSVIVRRLLAQASLIDGRSALEAFVSFNNTTYRHMRDSTIITGSERLSALEPYDKSFHNTIAGVFMISDVSTQDQKGLAIESLGSFLHGANLHFAFNQERHLQDDRGTMIFYNTIKSLITSYSAYARSMRSVMSDYRVSFIGDNSRFNGVSRGGFRYTDHFTGEIETVYVANREDSMAWIESERILNQLKSRHRGRLRREQERIFDTNVQPIIDNWDILYDDPVPAINQ